MGLEQGSWLLCRAFIETLRHASPGCRGDGSMVAESHHSNLHMLMVLHTGDQHRHAAHIIHSSVGPRCPADNNTFSYAYGVVFVTRMHSQAEWQALVSQVRQHESKHAEEHRLGLSPASNSPKRYAIAKKQPQLCPALRTYTGALSAILRDPGTVFIIASSWQ